MIQCSKPNRNKRIVAYIVRVVYRASHETAKEAFMIKS